MKCLWLRSSAFLHPSRVYSSLANLLLCTLLQQTADCTLALSLWGLLKCFWNPYFFVTVIAAAGHNAEGEADHFWYTNRKFTISLTAILVILPLSIPKEIGFQKYARYRTLPLLTCSLFSFWELISSSCYYYYYVVVFFKFTLIIWVVRFFSGSTLSVMGTWYVTIVVIIKYFWPDKEVTPGYVPTRCGHISQHFLNICILLIWLCLSC